ncbi:MAG: D-aminoacylase [Candidatus Sungbacteria bacterium]|nr:D-aminoacylase [Candidatus Sungbacteria bacterium]
MAYDILIRGGMLFDGLGNTPVQADVGIRGDTIRDIGAFGGASARMTIDASGKYVTPGFVDITNHSDTSLTLFGYPALESMLMQGVTTVIGGNCGASLAPLASREALYGIRKWADPSTINTNWNSFEEYLNQIDGLKPGPNFGSFVGYGTLRRNVIGNDVRTLQPQELEQARYLLAQAMDQGAFGLSLGLSYGHERVSPTEEIISVASALRARGGMVKMHLRSEGAGLIASVNEAVRIGREAGIPVHISHLKAIGRKTWDMLEKALELIENARASGVLIRFDVTPYATTGSSLYLLIPPSVRQAGFDDLFRRIDDPAERKKIIEEMKSSTLHPEKIFITSAKTKSIVGHTLADIAAHTGLAPEEALLQTVRANEGRVSIVGKTVSLKNVRVEIRNPASCIASDGAGFPLLWQKSGDLVHPRSFGAFGRVWRKFVREDHALSEEQAIAKMTSAPAQILGLADRGVLRQGAAADVLVFDPSAFADQATYENPFRFPTGIMCVIVNGQIAVENGTYTGVRAGRALRRV